MIRVIRMGRIHNTPFSVISFFSLRKVLKKIMNIHQNKLQHNTSSLVAILLLSMFLFYGCTSPPSREIAPETKPSPQSTLSEGGDSVASSPSEIPFSSSVEAKELTLMDSPAPKFRFDLQNSGRSRLQGPDRFKVLWKFKAGDKIARPPVIDYKGNIYFGSNDSHFYALSPSGKLLWKTKLDEWVDSTAVIAHDGTIFAGCDDGNLVAFSAKGKILWKYYMHAEISSSPTIANNLVYAGSEDGSLYGLTSDGKVKMGFKAGNRILVSSPLVMKNGDLVIGAEDSHIYRIKPDGSVRWKYKTDEEESFISPPLSDDEGNIYFSTPDKKIIALDADGKKIWEAGTHEEVFEPMAFDREGSLYVTALDGVILCYGKDRFLHWKTWVERKSVGGPVFDSRSMMYISGETAIYRIDNKGNRADKLEIKDDILLTSPVIGAGKKVFVGSKNGILYCIGEKEAGR